MKMNRILACAIFILIAQLMYGQNFTLSGYLRDANTGEELLFATVAVVETSQGINTNEYGFYSLTLPKGSYQINYSYVGYETTTIDIELTQNITQNIELGTGSTDLVEVVVTAENENDNITNTEVSVVSLDVKDFCSMKHPFTMWLTCWDSFLYSTRTRSKMSSSTKAVFRLNTAVGLPLSWMCVCETAI